MKFMLMIVPDEAAERALSAHDLDDLITRHEAFGRELRAAGKWVTAARLRFVNDAVTIRRRAGEVVVLDGPFAETKEVLGGFYLIEAESRAEAIEWAKKLPVSATSAVEVRPLWRDD